MVSATLHLKLFTSSEQKLKINMPKLEAGWEYPIFNSEYS